MVTLIAVIVVGVLVDISPVFKKCSDDIHTAFLVFYEEQDVVVDSYLPKT